MNKFGVKHVHNAKLLVCSISRIVVFLGLFLAQQATAVAEDAKPVAKANVQPTNIKGAFNRTLLLKPYITIGYHVPELFTHQNNTGGSDFFSDLSRFSNFKIGVGLRITSYLAVEVAYDSIARSYQIANSVIPRLTDNVRLNSHSIYVNAVFFSPSIDVKFGTLEFALNVGTMIVVSMQHDVLSAIPIPAGHRVVSSSLGPQFMAGFSIIYGFPKLFTIRGFTEVITLADTPFDIPVILNSGIAVNIYLL